MKKERVLVKAWTWETAPPSLKEQAPFRAEWLVLIEAPAEVPVDALRVVTGPSTTRWPLPDGRILLIGGDRR